MVEGLFEMKSASDSLESLELGGRACSATSIGTDSLLDVKFAEPPVLDQVDRIAHANRS